MTIAMITRIRKDFAMDYKRLFKAIGIVAIFLIVIISLSVSFPSMLLLFLSGICLVPIIWMVVVTVYDYLE